MSFIDTINTHIIRNETKEAIALLDTNTIDINGFTEYNKTLLHCACSQGNIEIAKRLLSHPEIDINLKGKTKLKHSALHIAVIENSVELTQLLIENGANINSQEGNGNTPLWTAVSYNNKNMKIPVIKYLLAQNADPNIKNNYGISLYKALTMPKNKDIIGLFPPEIN